MLAGLIRDVLGLSQIPLFSPRPGGSGPDSLQVCTGKEASEPTPTTATRWNADPALNVAQPLPGCPEAFRTQLPSRPEAGVYVVRGIERSRPDASSYVVVGGANRLAPGLRV